MNVLSLFDGISGAKLALDSLSLPITNYFACEIDAYAIGVALYNHPTIYQLGDIRELDRHVLPPIDLLIAGSPCQGFSRNGKRKAFNDSRSSLIYEVFDIIDRIQPRHFLLENVRMKQEWMNIITEHLFVEPVLVNSNRFSPQNRERLYWFNWDAPPLPALPCGLTIRDILSSDPTWVNDTYVNADYVKTTTGNHLGVVTGIPGMNQQHGRVFSLDQQSPTLTVSQRSGNRIKVWDDNAQKLRFLNCLELERLQGLPDYYTEFCMGKGLTSTTQRVKMIGNGFSIGTIAHLLGGLI